MSSSYQGVGGGGREHSSEILPKWAESLLLIRFPFLHSKENKMAWDPNRAGGGPASFSFAHTMSFFILTQLVVELRGL